MVISNARLLASLLTILLLTGCSSVFFYPDQKQYSSPEELNPDYQALFLDTEDGGQIHAWWLPAKTRQTKGSVLFFHGNAQNLSSHVINLAWLNQYGYNLLIFDYRGFGKSPGAPTVDKSFLDAQAAYDWLNERESGSIFIVGQSLGGALASGFVAQRPAVAAQINGLIIDASFASYQRIAREKLSAAWITWAFQYPLSWIVISGPDPDDNLAQLKGLPKFLIHSTRDEVIPFSHGQDLYTASSPPKSRLITDTPHGYTFMVRSNQQALLEFMAESQTKKPR
ncbi:alpha/beta hydrolase [Hahella ganghwensis]|uniref:alpha/beta hydrolase n=1 Tax=Hahella ganghwensis TaxID=286420 RepID=UPI00036EDC0B|nr:alpha/beta hydrolase [Hahella ganghwensis]